MLLHNFVRHFWLGLGLAVLSTHSAAATDDFFGPEAPVYHALVSFSIGPDFVNKGQAQTLTPIPPFEKYYTNTNPTATVVDGGTFLGVERVFNDQLWAQLGLSGYVDYLFNTQGNVWLFADPEFDTLSYKYHVRHSRAMLEGKILTTFNPQPALHPYFSWGVGAAFNQANSYQETALIPDAVPTPPFANHTQVGFAWALGLGADYVINTHARVGMGYQFLNLGSVYLGPTSASTNNETLNYPNLYTNQIRFQLTFIV